MTRPRDEVCECMDLIFQLQEKIESGCVTIDELTEVVRLAVLEGHDRISISLSMAGIAVERAKEPINV